MSAGSGIIEYLKKQGRSIEDIPFKDVREFQEFEKTFNAAIQSYDGRDNEIKYCMQSFTIVEALCMAIFMDKDSGFGAVDSCFKDIMKKFKNDDMFSDGITLMNWILFNFPTKQNGTPIVAEVLKDIQKSMPDLEPFILELLNSRLGMYEVKSDNIGKNFCKIKELITGRELTLQQSLGGVPKSNLVLLRVITIDKKTFAFGGNIPEFPSSSKNEIQEMVSRKMMLYFPHINATESYELMMRFAGPYWFSIVARNYTADILNPDYFLTFYGKRS